MQTKKKTTITQEVTGEIKNPYKSYFMDKIFPSFITLAVGAVGALVVMYFTVNALSSRVSALEENSVRQDVFTEVIQPIREDVTEIKEDVKDIKGFLIKQ